MRIQTTVRGDMVTMAAQATNANPMVQRLRMMAAAAIRMRQAFAANFNEGGRPFWAPLAPSTQRQKMAMYFAGTIRGRNFRGNLVSMRRAQPQAPGAMFTLVRTGWLKNSVVRSKSKGNVSRLDATSGNVELGTSVPYGQYHETGTSKMPARPFLTMTDADWEDVMNIMADMVFDPDAYKPTDI